VRQDRIDRGEQEGLSSQERARLGELERDNARLRMERDLRKRTVAFWVTETSRDALPLCRCPEGRRLSGRRRLHCRWGLDLGLVRLDRQRPPSSRTPPHRDQAGRRDPPHPRPLGRHLRRPRVTVELRRGGQAVNHKRVERLMRAHGIVGYRPRRRRSLTRQDRAAPPAPDLLGRLFDPDQVDLAWCGDITYIPTDEGWLYLASVIDLASRHLLGWSMSSHHDARLVTAALDAAVTTRGRQRMDGTIFHSDRGAEYTSAAYIDACARLGLRRSMGRTGSCLDNAVAESWFASLKVELVHRAHYRTRAEARASIFAWIAWYNRFRLHSTRGYLPPIEWEQQHAPSSPLPSTLAA
jgi:transposase InsO family protein